jgi:hypothetical protein
MQLNSKFRVFESLSSQPQVLECLGIRGLTAAKLAPQQVCPRYFNEASPSSKARTLASKCTFALVQSGELLAIKAAPQVLWLKASANRPSDYRAKATASSAARSAS